MTNRQRLEGAELPDLPPTAWAVLGLLSFRGARTGYELKKWADSSLRFFWADGTDDPGPPVLRHPLVLRLWLGHLAAPETLRALVERHLARTRDALAEVRGALRRAEQVPKWAFPRVALAWSERQHLAELALAEAMLADLARMAASGSADGA
ncbi:PadR family transcriptional regulator [Streptomyces sp. RGM 3693]|uniref:PadR family transcriptional regulator n=1 Tax=Streptomyces sp. RGM 3693 TaxID=3413284 RepID=UPI003D2D6C9C